MSQSKCCEIEEFAKALGQETRQQILRLLQAEELNVWELTQHLGLTQPTISHHLAILRRTKLVVSHRQGKQTFYRDNQDCVTECCQDILDKFKVSTENLSLV
jgi:DNA-binding transcriptional ArsR family regulator